MYSRNKKGGVCGGCLHGAVQMRVYRALGGIQGPPSLTLPKQFDVVVCTDVLEPSLDQLSGLVDLLGDG